MLGLAALGVGGASAFLYSVGHLNSNTPHLEIPFLASAAAVLVAAAAMPVELVRSANRPRSERASRGKRGLFHALALLVVLAGLGSGAVTVLAATFPKC